MKLKNLLAKELATIREKKNIVGSAKSIGLSIHLDSTYDKDTKQLSISISTQSAKAPEYIIPDIASETDVQEITSGLESEMAAAIRTFSKSMSNILDKYQQ